MDIAKPPIDTRHDMPRENLGILARSIGATSMAETSVLPVSIEAGYDRQRLLGLDNFTDSAKEFNVSKTIAKNAWNVLTRLFTLKDNPDPYRRYKWFREDEYDYVPLVFDHVPKKDAHGRYSSFQLTELHPDTIRPLLDFFDAELEIAGQENFVAVRDDILGTAASRTVIQFLRDIADSADPESTSS